MAQNCPCLSKKTPYYLGNVQVGQMFEFVESFGAIIRSFSMPGNINNDPTVWLDGARPPFKYVFKNNMSFVTF